MGQILREKLHSRDWRVVNSTPLPTICFLDGRPGAANSKESLRRIAGPIVDEGRAWISTTALGGERPVLRATITNYRTTPGDLEALLEDLDREREAQSSHD